MIALLLVDKTHHALNTGAVVPTAVEDDDLAAGGKTLDIALDEHLRLFAFRRRRQRHNAKDAGADTLSQRLDRTALAGSIAPFEHNDDLKTLRLHPFLQIAKLDLKLAKLLFIELPLHLAIVFVPFLPLGHGELALSDYGVSFLARRNGWLTGTATI